MTCIDGKVDFSSAKRLQKKNMILFSIIIELKELAQFQIHFTCSISVSIYNIFFQIA